MALLTPPVSLYQTSRPLEAPEFDAVFSHPEIEPLEYSPIKEEPKRPDLAAYGYSCVNGFNSLGILQKLEALELGGARSPPRKPKSISLSYQDIDVYRSVIRQLPCPPCVRNLVGIFFREASWQYTVLDRNDFMPQLERYYHQYLTRQTSPSADTTDSDKVIFSALLFQVLAYALQFLPPDHTETIHASCLRGVCKDGDATAEDATTRLLSLLPKHVINVDYIATQLLRTAWLKNRGLVAESWLVLAQSIIHAQEIGIHRDDGKLYAVDAESAIEELWEVVLRRRLMINLFLWDRYGMIKL